MNRTDAEKSRDREKNADKAPTAAIEAQIAADRIPVAGPNGATVGYITRDGLNAPFPTSAKDLVPVRDDSGSVVAYWAGGIGVIEKSVVDSGQFDPDAELAKKSLSRPTTDLRTG